MIDILIILLLIIAVIVSLLITAWLLISIPTDIYYTLKHFNKKD